MSQLHAKIKLQVAIMLARDIQAFLAGDLARFDRMVGAGGKSVISLRDARANIQIICEATGGQFPATSAVLLQWVWRMR